MWLSLVFFPFMLLHCPLVHDCDNRAISVQFPLWTQSSVASFNLPDKVKHALLVSNRVSSQCNTVNQCVTTVQIFTKSGTPNFAVSAENRVQPLRQSHKYRQNGPYNGEKDPPKCDTAGRSWSMCDWFWENLALSVLDKKTHVWLSINVPCYV